MLLFCAPGVVAVAVATIVVGCVVAAAVAVVVIGGSGGFLVASVAVFQQQ